jgi:hypothetical protein
VEIGDDGIGKDDRDAKAKGVVIDEEHVGGNKELPVGEVEEVRDIKGCKDATSRELVVEVEFLVEETGLLVGVLEEENGKEDKDAMRVDFVLNVEYNVAETELMSVKTAVNLG